jgi:hypothetical protein
VISTSSITGNLVEHALTAPGLYRACTPLSLELH